MAKRKIEAHVAHSLKPKMVLKAMKALLAFEPKQEAVPDGFRVGVFGNSAVSHTVGLSSFVPVESPLVNRQERLKAALAGLTPEEVCSNDVVLHGAYEAAVDILAESWEAGIPNEFKK